MNIPDYVNQEAPISAWSIKDLFQQRHNSTWMILSTTQCEELYENLVRYCRRTDETLERIYDDLSTKIGDAILNINQFEYKEPENTPGQPTVQKDSERKFCFSLWWGDVLERYSETRGEHATDILKKITESKDPEKKEKVLALIHQTAQESAATNLYEEWSDSLYDEQLTIYPPVLRAI